jgi:choline dehydrogenase-like flavoprotein
MGRDPAASVVGLDHQTHDVRGLYIVDGSTVPGATGVNPQLTIMAMATRAATKIADAL